MASLHTLPADVLALRDLRLARPRPLSAPPALTPTLRAHLPLTLATRSSGDS